MDVLSLQLAKQHADQKTDQVKQELDAHKTDYATQRSLDIGNNVKAQKPSGHSKRVQGYGVQSMPNNAKGQVAVSLKGNLYTNIVNGKGNSLNDWSSINYVTIYNNEYFRFDTSSGVSLRKPMSIKAGDKYYIQLKYYGDNASPNQRLTFAFRSLDNSVLASNTVNLLNSNNSLTAASAILTITSSLDGMLTAYRSDTSGGLFFVKEILLINLTELGLTDLTTEQCNQRFNFIDGAKSTLSQRVKSVGKNLFNKSKAIGGYLENATGKVILGGSSYCSALIKLLPGTQYNARASLEKVAFYDINKNFINIQTNSVTAFTTPANCTYIIIQFNLTGKTLDDIQIATVATPYEPYVESIAYIPSVGKSLPNGVKDEFNVMTGELKQNIGSEIITVGKVTQMGNHAAKDNKYGAIITVSNRDYIRSNNLFVAGSFNQLSGYDVSPYTSSLWQIIVYVPDGTTLEQAKSMFDGKVLTYQLATPIITPPDAIGEVIPYPNGSIWAEPCIWGFQKETTKTITTADLPISEIRKVERYDISEVGKLVKVDVTASCTLDASKTKLTIGGFQQGKVYFYDCDYTQELTTQPELVLDVEVDNGVLTKDFGATATAWELTANEAKASMLICTNAGGNANIVAPAIDGKIYVIRNNSTKTITIKTASSTGVQVLNGKITTVMFVGTDFIKIGEV